MLHLLTGRPLFSVPLSPTHSVHADINSDGIIDHVHAVVSPGDGEMDREQEKRLLSVNQLSI